ncbi:hypothetical protein LCGC14_1135430 [marine sediment metagenome]|uniref:Uncharacterized protein n=1 Tax=marine sediment metagenome TaxID=412755 RepID=A0A0F9PI20_9ZZZZ
MGIEDVFNIFGGGGGGGGGDGGFSLYLEELKKEQARMEDLEGRELEQAETSADLRRGEYLDRTGFAGLVNVGESVQRSDATLAAQVAGLAEDDPARVAYEDALAAEREDRTSQTRLISGEQYRAEDAMAALEARLEEGLLKNQPGTLRSDYGKFIEKYEWYDDDFLADLAAREKANEEKSAGEVTDRVGHNKRRWDRVRRKLRSPF